MAKTISVTVPAIQDLRPKPWTFSQATDFERSVQRTLIGGAFAGLTASVWSIVFGDLGFSAFTSVVFLSCSIAITTINISIRKCILAVILGIGASIVYDLYDNQWAGFAALLSGLLLAPVFAGGRGIRQMLVTGIGTGLAIFAGAYTTQVLQSQAVLSNLVPNMIAQVAYGSIFGMFIGLGACTLHIKRKNKSLTCGFDQAIQETKDAETRDLLARASGLYQLVTTEFKAMDAPAHPEIETQVEALGNRVLNLGVQCNQLQADLQRAHLDDLKQRIGDVRKKIETSQDAAARATLNEAITNLEEQQQALCAIERSRDRVIARIHADVALLERLRLALMQLRNTHVQNQEQPGFELNISLEAISQEIEATCSVVDEVYLYPIQEQQRPVLTKNFSPGKVNIEDAVSPETMILKKTA